MKPEKQARELSEDEKLVLNLLTVNSPIDLNELKNQTGLSNKKWLRLHTDLKQSMIHGVITFNPVADPHKGWKYD